MKSKLKEEISAIPRGELDNLVLVLTEEVRCFDARRRNPECVVRDICSRRLVITKHPSLEQTALDSGAGW